MKASRRQIIIAVAIVIVIAIGGFAIGYNVTSLMSGSKMFYLEKVKTEVKSATDGEEHSLEARFVVELDKSMDGSVDLKTLQQRITEVVSGLDYDILTDKDGTSYIKEEIKKNILDYVPEDKIVGIYITDIMSDFYLPDDSGSIDSRKDVFEALFPNTKNN